MNATPTKPETPDELDKLFSDFFKAQLKCPWPNAPFPAADSVTPAAEPSGLVHTHTETPRNSPTPAPQAKARDGTARARFTLAASVALALGTCWVLSNGFLPGKVTQGTPVGPGILQDGGADGSNHPTLKTLQDNKVFENKGGSTDTGKGGFLEKTGDGNDE